MTQRLLFRSTVLVALAALGTAPASLAAPQPFGNDLANAPTTAINGTQTTYSPRTGGTAGAQTMPVAAPISGVITNFKIRHGAGQSGTVKWFIATKTAEATFASRFAAQKAAASGDPGNITSHTPTDGGGDPIGVPVSAGEYIAAHSTGSLSMQVFSNTLAPGGKYAFFHEAEPPTTATGWNVTDPPSNGGREATVQATVEPDADGDSYGDDTQDTCPGNPALHEGVCTTDTDGDGALDNADNCPALSNPGQEDFDGDGDGDACDTDGDDDGVANTADNCDLTANPGQQNLDGDAQGDACDADDDNDTVADGSDNCPTTANAGQNNFDGAADGGDSCDADDDNDGVDDGFDNCPFAANFAQTNTDQSGDGGDACDADDDNDGTPDSTDAFPLDPTRSAPLPGPTPTPAADRTAPAVTLKLANRSVRSRTLRKSRRLRLVARSNEAARLRIVVKRGKRTVGTATADAAAGADQRISARLAKTATKRGRLTVTITATDAAGNVGRETLSVRVR